MPIRILLAAATLLAAVEGWSPPAARSVPLGAAAASRGTLCVAQHASFNSGGGELLGGMQAKTVPRAGRRMPLAMAMLEGKDMSGDMIGFWQLMDDGEVSRIGSLRPPDFPAFMRCRVAH